MPSTVSVVFDARAVKYPALPPFHPEINYPEIITTTETDPGNFVYGMVRKLFYNLGYDIENYSTVAWNPLKHLISPGDNVVIKPNLAKHEHHMGDEGLLCTITHGSVLRPIIDYVNIALQGKGSIIICDTPFEYADFSKMCEVTGIKDTITYLKQKGYSIELRDLRKYITKFYSGNKTRQYEQNGDPSGYVVVDIKDQSEFHELDKTGQNYHTLADHTVDHYDPFSKDIGETNKHHRSGKHEYLIARTILNADVIISVPKLKTHGKAGVTLNLKNMIGIASGKTYMPHHRPGNQPYGDAFPTPPPEEFIKRRFIRRKIAHSVYWLQNVIGDTAMKKVAGFFRNMVLERFWPVKDFESKRIEWGDWYGNDTLWRTILDLNKILLYCDKDGNLKDTRQRKYFSVIDGIIGQEGQGPTMGTPKQTFLLIAGEDPVAVDTIAVNVMGLDKERIPVIVKTAQMRHRLGTSDMNRITVKSNIDYIPKFNFKPPRGWEILSKKQ
jgi:uncharacterized protein (DUF362 family)